MQTTVGDGIYQTRHHNPTLVHLSELLCTSKSQFLLLLIPKISALSFAVPNISVLLNTCH